MNLLDLYHSANHDTFGTIVQHPTFGKAVVVDIDCHNYAATLWFEHSMPGRKPVITIVQKFNEYKIIAQPSAERLQAAMKALLNQAKDIYKQQ